MKNWEKQFNTFFNHNDPNDKALVIIETDDFGGVSQRPAQKEVKQFIKELLESQKSEIIELAEGMKKSLDDKYTKEEQEVMLELVKEVGGTTKTPKFMRERSYGYNLALQDIINKTKIISVGARRIKKNSNN